VKRAIELDFPFEKIDEIAEIESYRKEINRPIYYIHKWWAKRLGSVFRAIVSGSLSENSWFVFHEQQNYAGKIVLDPFMGSGTTLGESLKLGAKVIGCDVNPVSTFIVKQALTSVNLNDLETEFKAIEKDVKHEILSFYTTKVPGASKHTPALYYFWVKIVTTPDGEDIPLFSSYVFSKNAYPSKKPESQIWCPLCENIFIAKYNSTNEQCPECSHIFNPQVGPVKGAKVFDKYGNEYKIKDLVNYNNHAPNHKLYAILALNEQGEKVYIKPTEFDHDLFNRAKQRLEELKTELPLPTMAIRSGYNTKQAKGYNYHYWYEFFNERQLLCLGILLKRILKIENKTIRDQFVCLFSGILEFNNLFCSFKGEGTGAVRHLFSHHILKPERTPLENTVWGIEGKSSGSFSTLFKSRLLKAKAYLDNPFEIMIDNSKTKRTSKKLVCSNPINVVITDDWNSFKAKDNSALVLNGDSSILDIPDSSVDAIVTDPPYFDFIHYSELSDFFYAWLSKALGGEYSYFLHQDSSHKNEVQDKDYQQFSYKISKIFIECFRVLKTEGIMCFSYHHSTIEGWIAIYNAVSIAGFNIVAAHPVKAEMSVSTPKSATKEPINLDTILICKKQNKSSKIKNHRMNLKENIEKYVQRFDSIGRKLSSGDKFVIACSQIISFASCNNMTEKETTELLQCREYNEY
jgi:putative DNA methylase